MARIGKIFLLLPSFCAGCRGMERGTWRQPDLCTHILPGEPGAMGAWRATEENRRVFLSNPVAAFVRCVKAASGLGVAEEPKGSSSPQSCGDDVAFLN